MGLFIRDSNTSAELANLHEENRSLKEELSAPQRENAILRSRLAKYEKPTYQTPVAEPGASSSSIIQQQVSQYEAMAKKYTPGSV